MSTINLCDTCLHTSVCSHGLYPHWGRMAHCRHYERLILAEAGECGMVPLWFRTSEPPKEEAT